MAVSAPLVRPATIETRHGQRFWVCPNCGRIIAELIGDRAVVKIGERIFSMALRAEPDQTCPRCGQVSVASSECIP